jgi:hypothetical protein
MNFLDAAKDRQYVALLLSALCQSLNLALCSGALRGICSRLPLFRGGIILFAKNTEAGQSQPDATDDIARIEFCFKG